MDLRTDEVLDLESDTDGEVNIELEEEEELNEDWSPAFTWDLFEGPPVFWEDENDLEYEPNPSRWDSEPTTPCGSPPYVPSDNE